MENIHAISFADMCVYDSFSTRGYIEPFYLTVVVGATLFPSIPMSGFI